MAILENGGVKTFNVMFYKQKVLDGPPHLIIVIPWHLPINEYWTRYLGHPVYVLSLFHPVGTWLVPLPVRLTKAPLELNRGKEKVVVSLLGKNIVIVQ